MKNYLIVVEGAHDITVVERLLILNGVDQKIRSMAELPSVWKHTLPEKFPFRDGRLERITPIPSFLMNKEISVAIKNANSDSEIMPVLQQIMDTMLVSEKDQIRGIMLLCDADKQKAADKMKELLDSYEEKEDFRIIREEEKTILDIGIRRVPLHSFVFPDNENTGNLENLLLEAAQAAYPGLLALAETFVAEAAQLQQTLRKEQNAKKAKVGCIANAMKPGKANQVSIADDEWITEETIRICRLLQKVDKEILKMITFDKQQSKET